MASEGPGRQGSPKPLGVGRDLFMVALAVVSIAFLIYDEVEHPVGATRQAMIWIDGAIVVVFVLEFSFRYLRAEDKGLFLRKNWYEIPGMIPMALGEASFLRVFRLARLARVFRILRAVTVLSRLKRANRVASSFLQRSHVLGIATTATTVIVAGAYAAWFFERSAPHDPPNDWSSFSNALWWAIVTAATVGYGDMYPVTGAGRVVASLLMITGIGLIGVFTASLANALIRNPASAPAPVAERTLEQRLEMLSALHREGRLSDAEFREAKTRVLQEP